MTRDGAWNLDLQYNMIDRAQNVKQDGVTLANYSYLWDGTKLSTLKGDGTGLVYLGSLVYKKSGNTLSAESIAFSGGRIAAATAGTTTTYTPNYHVTDHLGSVRVVVDGNGTVLERSDYYPYGLRWDNAALTAPANRYRYNGKEEQAFAGLPYIDYGARQYDPKFRLAWNGSDPMAHKYYPVGPYAFCGNNPINVIDPDGRDSYLLIWFSRNNETGHAGIAVDNYKQQEIRDKKGNVVLDSKGNPTYETVKDGTMTYYDLWPNSPVGKTELQSNVKSDYSKGVTINSLSDLQTKDPTGSRSGSVSAEGRAADGIVQINTTYDQDTKIQGYAAKTASSGKAYNASDFNCSTFAESALKTVFPTLDASQYVKIPFPLSIKYHDTRVVAPNNLYNATMKLPGATNISGPKSVVAKPYLQYYGK